MRVKYEYTIFVYVLLHEKTHCSNMFNTQQGR